MGVYFLEMYDELSKSVAFGQKLKYFTNQNRPRVEEGGEGGWAPHENEILLFSKANVMEKKRWEK